MRPNNKKTLHNIITLIKINDVKLPAVDALELALEPYGDRFLIVDSQLLLKKETFDEGRKQFDAKKILFALHELKQQYKWQKVLGITYEDIFIDGMNFVFGLASPIGEVCIVSLHRLIERQKPELSQIEEARIVKEIAHEIGHVYGLEHCDRNCVMAFSNSVRHVDDKESSLCEKCKNILSKK